MEEQEQESAKRQRLESQDDLPESQHEDSFNTTPGSGSGSNQNENDNRNDPEEVESPPFLFGGTSVSLVDQVICNHLVLKEIFKHLSVPDLLEISLVNKLWNSGARTVLRENKKCLIKIGKDRPCIYLQEFLNVLNDSSEIPFNGLSIMTRSPYEDDHDCVECDEASELYAPLLSRVNIKYLEIGWDDELGCPAIAVLEKVFTERAAYLEGLYLHELPFAVESIAEYFFGETNSNPNPNSTSSSNKTTIWLPKLKTLQLPGEDFTYDCSRLPLIHEIIRSAPNLQQLLGGIQSKFIDFFFLEEKIHTLKEFLFQPGNKTYNNFEQIIHNLNQDPEGEVEQNNYIVNEINKDLQASLRFAREHPKLKKLTICTEHMKNKIKQDPASSFSQVSEILQILLEASCDTLEEVQISHLDMILLQRLQFPPLSRVRHLIFTHNRSVDSLEGYTTLARIDFNKVFPNLESIEMGGSSVDELNFYITEEFRQNPREYTCPTVSKLELAYGDNELEIQVNPLRVTLKDGNYQDIKIRYAKIFPNVKHFRIGHCKKLKNLCSSLWTAWNDLETIVITHVDDDVIFENLDSIFTGIPEEQCVALRESKVFEDFETLQSQPSIRNLPKLQKLRIEIDHENTCTKRFHRNLEPKVESPPCLFSDVTCKCAFALMPNLSVEIVRRVCKPWKMKCRFALEHLSSYVKLINYGPPELPGSSSDENYSSDTESDDSDFPEDSNTSGNVQVDENGFEIENLV